MIRRPPRFTRPHTLFPYPTLFRSVAAFEAAIAAGHGFELDVQETADGQALVFHDYDLHRLTGGRGAVREKVMTDLAAIHLAGTEQPLVHLQPLDRKRVV